ncbi:hypothetical protein [Salicibibacter halophilus]|nr:hypothetical protein [Salicibibacter halophilus]
MEAIAFAAVVLKVRSIMRVGGVVWVWVVFAFWIGDDGDRVRAGYWGC